MVSEGPFLQQERGYVLYAVNISMYIYHVNRVTPMDTSKRKCLGQQPQDSEDAPLPDTDLSPALQRTIQRKLEEGEEVEGDSQEMEEIIRKMTKKRAYLQQ